MFIICPPLVIFGILFFIGYVLYICYTPEEVIMARHLRKREKRINKILPKDKVRDFLEHKIDCLKGDYVEYIIIRDYFDLMNEYMSKGIKFNKDKLKKAFRCDITNIEGRISYIQELYGRVEGNYAPTSFFGDSERYYLKKAGLLTREYYINHKKILDDYYRKNPKRKDYYFGLPVDNGGFCNIEKLLDEGRW